MTLDVTTNCRGCHYQLLPFRRFGGDMGVTTNQPIEIRCVPVSAFGIGPPLNHEIALILEGSNHPNGLPDGDPRYLRDAGVAGPCRALALVRPVSEVAQHESFSCREVVRLCEPVHHALDVEPAHGVAPPYD